MEMVKGNRNIRRRNIQGKPNEEEGKNCELLIATFAPGRQHRDLVDTAEVICSEM